MICKFQLKLYTSKFNLKIFLVGTKTYVQFHNIKFKMPQSQLLIELETSFKTWQKAQHVNIPPILKAYIWCYPFHPSVQFLHLWKCWQLWMAPNYFPLVIYLWKCAPVLEYTPCFPGSHHLTAWGSCCPGHTLQTWGSAPPRSSSPSQNWWQTWDSSSSWCFLSCQPENTETLHFTHHLDVISCFLFASLLFHLIMYKHCLVMGLLHIRRKTYLHFEKSHFFKVRNLFLFIWLKMEIYMNCLFFKRSNLYIKQH